MDNWVEILVSVLVLGAYAVSSLLGKKEEPGPPKPGPAQRRGDQQPVSEEVRRIQEEIKRKIVARQQGKPEPQPGETRPAPSQPRPAPAQSRPAPVQRRREEESQTRQDPAYKGAYSGDWKVEKTPDTRVSRGDPFSSGQEDLLERQMRALEDSRRQAEEARQQARDRISRAAAARGARAKAGPASLGRFRTNREFILHALAQPQTARSAYLLHEVLGTPVGLRRNGEMRRSWD